MSHPQAESLLPAWVADDGQLYALSGERRAQMVGGELVEFESRALIASFRTTRIEADNARRARVASAAPAALTACRAAMGLLRAPRRGSAEARTAAAALCEAALEWAEKGMP